MIYRDTVKERFSHAAPEYEARADFQQEVAEELLALLHKITPGDIKSGPIKILDTGCGTGRLMKALSGRTDIAIFGLDIALPMLFEAAKALNCRGVGWGKDGVGMASEGGEGRCGLVNGACEALPLRSDLFDLVVSNLAYQWVGDLTLAFTEVQRVLLPGGRFVFSTLGPATLNELLSSLAEAQREMHGSRFTFTPFTPEGDIKASLESAGLRLVSMRKKIIMRSYNNPLHLLTTLKKTGASARGRITEKNLSMGTFLRRAIRIYEKKFTAAKGGIPATYEVLFIIAEKKL